MNCIKCKTEVPVGSRFCLQCGAKLYQNDNNIKRPKKPGMGAKSSTQNQSNRVLCYFDESLFQKPDVESPVIAPVKKGDILTILNEESSFYSARLETGEQKGLMGYIGMWVVSPPETEEQKQPEPIISANTQDRGAKIKEIKKSSEKNMILKYTGDGADLLWHGLVWSFLTAITIGIYYPWAINNFCQYIIEHIEIKNNGI